MKRLFLATATILVVALGVFSMFFPAGMEASNETLLFTGENEQWEASLQVENEIIWIESEYGMKEHRSTSHDFFILSYKGEISELSNLNEITYGYDCIGGGGGMSCTEEGPLKAEYTGSSGSSNSSLPNENSEILVTVTIGGVTEEFYLTQN